MSDNSNELQSNNQENEDIVVKEHALLIATFWPGANAQKVQDFINKGASPTKKSDNSGNTPLHFACLYRKIDVVKLLLPYYDLSNVENNINLNTKNKAGETPLHIICSNRVGKDNDEQVMVEIAELLIEEEANPNIEDANQNIPLHNAAQQGLSKVTELLLESNSNINAQNSNKDTPLHIAAKNDNNLIAYKILDSDIFKNEYEADKRDANNENVLHIASKIGEIRITKRILEKDSSIIDKENGDGETPLYLACRYGYRQVVEILLSYKNLKINTQNKAQYTPIHVACARGFSDIVNLLLNRKASLIIRNSEGNNALHTAIKNHKTEIVKTLIENKNAAFDVNETDNDGKTPLDIALSLGLSDIVKILQNNGAKRSEYEEKMENARKDYIKNESVYKHLANNALENIKSISIGLSFLCILLFFGELFYHLMTKLPGAFNSDSMSIKYILILLPIVLTALIAVLVFYRMYLQNQKIANIYNHKKTSFLMLEAMKQKYGENSENSREIVDAMIDIVKVNPAEFDRKGNKEDAYHMLNMAQSLIKTASEAQNIVNQNKVAQNNVNQNAQNMQSNTPSGSQQNQQQGSQQNQQ